MPSWQGLVGEPTPSRATPGGSAGLVIRMPEAFEFAKSVKPVPYVWSGTTVPE